jgi:hypothetical protein
MARFDSTMPEELRPMKWYFADPSATLFAGKTPFRSNNYRPLRGDTGQLGEVDGFPRPWQNGRTPSPYPTARPCYGSYGLENGRPLGGHFPIDPSGVKHCCYRVQDCCTGVDPLHGPLLVTLSSDTCECLDGLNLMLVWDGAKYSTPLLTAVTCLSTPPGVPCYVYAEVDCFGTVECQCCDLVIRFTGDSGGGGPGDQLAGTFDPDCDCGPPFTAKVSSMTWTLEPGVAHICGGCGGQTVTASIVGAP